ncbi:hypothetical protein TELCIR_10911 [Teladorsagia circumcincta]|uniref:Peptidase S9 prolyl oligopeptidase catalytic domain-containing protein n=1 Tax=Teladorsagia circumcincta TaxID=45464 RepID=A0A2G9UC86_TELCI|nr:hypothetical protein TELCIR_10911 [Teladorsagia circumcincta]
MDCYPRRPAHPGFFAVPSYAGDGYSWTGVDDVIIYSQDNDGDENTMFFKKNISEVELGRNPEKRTVISDQKGVKAYIIENNLKDSRVLIGLNDENPAYHNVYSFDLLTDSMTLVMKNSRFHGFIVDNDLNIRLACEEQQDGSLMYIRPSLKANPALLTSNEAEWEQYLIVQPDDRTITSFIGFDKTNQNMYWQWGEQSDLGSLVMIPFDAADRKEVLYTARRAEIDSVMIHPTDMTLLAVTEAEFLFTTWPEMKQYELNRQVGFEFKARDGMVLQAYLSLPSEATLRIPKDVPAVDRSYAELGMLPVEPQKVVVLVHGGPQSRDLYGYSPENAFLTNRGYAVLQVNYRGSKGFGKRLVNAGYGEWGRKMHFDVLDAVEFAVDKGITDRSKVAIMDQFVAALKRNNIPVTYVFYPDEGHGFKKANNILAQHGFIEKFLHMCLGGRYEPYHMGQHNSSAILMSDGFAAAPPTPTTIAPLPVIPSLTPQLFY